MKVRVLSVLVAALALLLVFFYKNTHAAKSKAITVV